VTGDADETAHQRAAELYRQARELHAREDYWKARELYEQSLECHEDAEVRAAYMALLATIGPM
jgi:hypothetical protein